MRRTEFAGVRPSDMPANIDRSLARGPRHRLMCRHDLGEHNGYVHYTRGHTTPLIGSQIPSFVRFRDWGVMEK